MIKKVFKYLIMMVFVSSNIIAGTKDVGIKLISSFTVGGSISNIIYSPDGKFIASAEYEAIDGDNNTSGENAVKIWDSKTGTLANNFLGHLDGASNLSYSPNGEYIASCSYDNSIKIWNLITKRGPVRKMRIYNAKEIFLTIPTFFTTLRYV